VPESDPYFHGPEAGPHFAPNLWPALSSNWVSHTIAS
jgi:hypothetical protein